MEQTEADWGVYIGSVGLRSFERNKTAHVIKEACQIATRCMEGAVRVPFIHGCYEPTNRMQDIVDPVLNL